jgi:hypothetical protein
VLLFLLFFGRDRSIDLEHTFGKVHAHLPLRYIYAFQIGLGEGHIKPFSRAGYDEQRSFAGPELNVFDAADFMTMIDDYTADQIADVRPAPLQLRAFGTRDLQLRSDQ